MVYCRAFRPYSAVTRGGDRWTVTVADGLPIEVAVDIGGTFTDLVALDAATGQVVRAKADTTARQLSRGVLAALERSGVTARQVGAFVHGTTVVINAITTRSGARTALVTTKGFRDVLEIGRANRPDIYNLAYRKPVPFVPRHLRLEVRERMSYRGEVIEPVREAELAACADQLAALGVQSVAVCLLHAWANPAHEAEIAAALTARLPGVSVIASHQVSRQWREYERTSSAVLSAYVQPVVSDYLGTLEASLRETAVPGQLYAMQSNGGVCSFGRAATASITLLESGPVAGVMAAAELGRRIGAQHVLTLDIGGTTAKTATIRAGQLTVNSLHHIGRTPAFAGYPVQSPTVEIVEIGAGGGSIAWVDQAGGLHVGPRSAGAEPGPACYGRGGTDPTLTDANLVAGRLDPEYFLAGERRLDVGRAQRALADLGRPLGTDARTMARGVIRYAIGQMSNALRLVTIRRGYDPRDFVFVAYGGAGPLHAALLARELNIARTIIPPGPGHFSAVGMLVGQRRADAVRTVVGPLASTDLTEAYALAEHDARAELAVPAAAAAITRYAELRYRGQEHTLEVTVPEPPVAPAAGAVWQREVRASFDQRCRDVYAFSLDVPLEVISIRVSVSVPSSHPESWLSDDDDGGPGPPQAFREVDLDPYGGVTRVPAVSRGDLGGAGWLPGPCVVEESAATTLVLPDQAICRDGLGNLIIEERR
jgi:N-methylhydantoinase A